MDCEKFDEHVMDAMYGELDELTHASLRRHVDSCGRCSNAFEGLTRAREDAILPMIEPSADLEERILVAERAVYGRAPWYRKVVRAAAWAGSHAMRPQLAMAALFMFVIGSSVLLLRARPGTVAAPVQVDERGSPEASRASEASPVSQAPMAARGAAKGDGDRNDDGEDTKRAKVAAADEPAPDATAAATAAPASEASAIAVLKPAAPGEAAVDKLLADARAVRESSGCSAAAPSFEALAQSHPESEEGKQAQKELEACRMTAAKSPPRPAPPATTTTAAPAAPAPPAGSTAKPPTPGGP